jgi:transposase-like protein
MLSLWLEQKEGAQFWLRVMNELRDRGSRECREFRVRAAG